MQIYTAKVVYEHSPLHIHTNANTNIHHVWDQCLEGEMIKTNKNKG